MNKVIDISRAEIKTATVEVRQITIDARKMTLSVFRQIPEENIFLDTVGGLILAGLPWGRIAYYWGDQNTNHLHILWQKDTELRRALIGKIKPLTDADLDRAIDDNYVSTALGTARWSGVVPWWFPDHIEVPAETEYYKAGDIENFKEEKVAAIQDIRKQREKILRPFFSRARLETESWMAHYNELSKLDQLFIAV